MGGVGAGPDTADVSVPVTRAADALSLGIGTVYQEVNLLPNLSVAENLFIGRQPHRFGLVRTGEMRRLSEELLAGYGLDIDVANPLSTYSVAVQQIVAIARAVDLSAKVLILDEPTASLDANEVETLFRILRDLKGRGIGIVNKIRAYALQDQGADTVEANERLGLAVDLRDYRQCAEILFDLGLCRVKVISNNPLKLRALEEAGLTIVERVSIEVDPPEDAEHYLRTKKEKLGHLLDLKRT